MASLGWYQYGSESGLFMVILGMSQTRSSKMPLNFASRQGSVGQQISYPSRIEVGTNSNAEIFHK